MISSPFQLPPHPHIPGKNARHAEGFADDIIRTLPETVVGSAKAPAAWHHALLLMENGYFWEAHEVLEAIWMRTPRNSREYFLVQGTIHVTNGALKALMGRPQAVSRLREMARECFDRVFRNNGNEQVLGFNQEGVREWMSEYL